MPPAGDTALVFRTVLRNRAIRRTMAAFLAFNAQEHAVWLAVTLYAYERGGAATAGAVATAQLVPAALIAPLGSVLGDRIARRRALLLGYLLQAISAAGLGVAMWLGPPLLAYGLAVIAACSITLTRPVQNALLPELSATPDELTAANSVAGTIESLGLMVGPLLNSALIVLEGPGTVCVAFGAVMGGAALLTTRLPAAPPGRDRPAEVGTGLMSEVTAAVRRLRVDPQAAAVTAFAGVPFAMLGMFDIFYAVLAVDLLATGAEGAGVLNAAVGLGGLAGAAATALLVGRRRLGGPVGLGAVLMGAAAMVVALPATLIPVVALLALAGAAKSYVDVGVRTILQRSVDGQILARVFGIHEALVMTGLAVGAAAVPVLIAVLGTRGGLVGAGALLLVCGVIVLPAMFALDRRATLPDPTHLSLLRATGFLARAPHRVLERLAVALQPVSVPAGAEFIRQGDPGHHLFVLASGEYVVERSGTEVARHSEPGSYVGEIALLREEPRTSSVRATTHLELYALGRDDFLSALGASPRALGSVHEEAARRLGELRALEEEA